ncbi:MAG TPA: hypothetical protein VH369_13670 [Bryobacteraceae bacterium]|jgi:hypothetical protein
MKLLPAAIVGLLTISVVRAQAPPPGLEAEFVAPDIFRSGSLVARTWNLHFDGNTLAPNLWMRELPPSIGSSDGSSSRFFQGSAPDLEAAWILLPW